MSSLRIIATITAGLGLLTLGVALLVAPPHSVAEATPPPDSDIPLVLICRTGGKMRLDVGPRDHFLHYTLRPGLRPKKLDTLKPGECASGNTDIPLGSATIPSVRFGSYQPNVSEGVGFAYTMDTKGVGSIRAVAQGPCVASEPQCIPNSAARAHAAELESFLQALQTPNTLVQLQVSRDTVRGMGPVSSFYDGYISYPQDNL